MRIRYREKAPFNQGPQATMYTGKPWTIRQYSGLDATESNGLYGSTGKWRSRHLTQSRSQNHCIAGSSGFPVYIVACGPLIRVLLPVTYPHRIVCKIRLCVERFYRQFSNECKTNGVGIVTTVVAHSVLTERKDNTMEERSIQATPRAACVRYLVAMQPGNSTNENDASV